MVGAVMFLPRCCKKVNRKAMMKHLLIALAAAVMVSTAYARILTGQDFESGKAGFTSIDGDESTVVEYGLDGSKPGALYPFAADPNANYLSIDTGDGKLVCSNDVPGDVYFDMYMQFKPCSSQPRLDPEAKIAVYLDAATSNLVVVAANQSGATNVTTTGVSLEPDTWGRLTVAAKTVNSKLQFTVRLDGEDIAPSGTTFYSLVNDTTVNTVCFKGSGALDDFVARTTDPYFDEYSTYSAWVGSTDDCEKYLTYTEALTDVLAGTPSSISFTFNGATNQVDGSADYPYQIPDAASLKILANAVNVNPAVRSLNYVQTANINMNGVADFYGIGWFSSSTSFASVPSGVASDGKTDIPFAGTYDGQGYTISNVTIVKHSYAGVFNNVSGCVKNLTVQDVGLSGSCSEWGCAIVGNAGDGSLLENLKAVTSSGFDWGSSANHNVAGIVVRPIGTATIRGCVNNANISAGSKRLGGIAAFVGSGSVGTVFDSCTNNAALVSTDGTRGVGGILGCAEGGVKNSPTDADTIIRNCADFGSETAQGSGGHAGAIVGSNWNESYTYTDAGGNTFKASSAVCGYIKNPVFGLAFATKSTIDSVDYLTTVSSDDISYTAGTTYYAVVAGDHTITAEDNTTLNFNIDTNGFNSVITLDVPEGIAVNIYNSAAIGGVTVLTGSGRLVTGAGAGSFQTLVKQSGWTGTLEVSGADITGVLNNYGNANSVLCLNNAGFKFSDTGNWNNIQALEIGANGADLLTPTAGAGTFNIPCALTGSGTLTVKAATDSVSYFNFTGDVSGFAGSLAIAADANSSINFGSGDGGASAAKQIGVKTGGVVTVAAGKTWTANDFIFNGTETINGTLIDLDAASGASNVGVVWNNKDTAVLRVNNEGACRLGYVNNWRGTYVIGWAGSNDSQIPFNSFGNKDSKIEIPTDSALEGYIEVRDGNTLTNNAEIAVNGVLNLSNGYNGSTVVWKKISGEGTVKYAFLPRSRITEKIVALDGFTGSIEISATTMLEIETVNVATTPAEGALVVPMTVTAGGTVGGDLKLFVDGSDSGKTLEYKADGANGDGLYVVESSPVVPVISPSTNTVYDCGSADAALAVAAAINAAKADYIKAPDDAGLSGETATAYANLFDVRADGTSVVLELNSNGTNALETAATNIAAQVVAPANLDKILSDTRSITVTGAQPGFYYSVLYSADLTSLDSNGVEGDRVVAEADGEVALPMPAKAVGATAGFYKVLVNLGDKIE